MLDNKGCQTTMSSTEKLTKDKGTTFENPPLYRSIVGSLQYVIRVGLELPSLLTNSANFLMLLLCFIGKPANMY